ncbi:MAG: hypothetical protein OMM_00561 [Candidatus Magnetoglobus multicellularis str. Araruama]|uniref:Uncharacterized protein n=1 Tax=Candidatus Magnetoglobus multicellularis str. Araruama TaxID=890399 RepID=A0A1V1PGG2_9BACT|nr:MAG: hypothetical protein OMM_00561 [Candidatus Magnetoglobus multicellularis str. Araruama]
MTAWGTSSNNVNNVGMINATYANTIPEGSMTWGFAGSYVAITQDSHSVYYGKINTIEIDMHDAIGLNHLVIAFSTSGYSGNGRFLDLEIFNFAYTTLIKEQQTDRYQYDAQWEKQDLWHYNLNYGFTQKDSLKIPAIPGQSIDFYGNALTNPPWDGSNLNDAESYWQAI